MSEQSFTDLLDQYLLGRLTPQQAAVLEMELSNPARETALAIYLRSALDNPVIEASADESVRDRLEIKLNEMLAKERPVRFINRSWLRYAAILLLLAGTASYLFYLPSFRKNRELSQTPKPKDILPGGNKAILTLSDGSTIVLDSVANGNLAQQGNSTIVKLNNGQLAYNPSQHSEGLHTGSAFYNTISTPKGGQYQVVLPDGSKVWLNAASSIMFPATFTGTKRNITVTGEVYMEIAQNAKQPFVVNAEGSEIQVLGTSFNINAYKDEGALKTTLIEGSVKVINMNETALLKPGQQAIVMVTGKAGENVSPGSDQQSTKHQTIHIQSANLSQAIAWKDGIFNFKGLDVKSVMHQLERWYDIKVQYKGSIPENLTFGGKMYRNVSLSSVLIMLREMGVKLKLEEKTLIIL